MKPTDRPIGFLDSGVGGISVLHRAMRLLPSEDFVYYADLGNAPYGSRTGEQIRALSLAAARRVYKQGVKALVVACNTATSAAIEDIRAQLDIPVLGMEPAVKPACAQNPTGRIAVLATPATLRMERFENQLARCCGEAQIVRVPCPGLSRLIETAGPQGEGIDEYLHELLEPHRDRLDAVVVGCTHFVFIQRRIRAACGAPHFYNGVQGTAQRLLSVLQGAELLRAGIAPGTVRLLCTDDSDEHLRLLQRFYALPVDYE